jgi:iron complex outermembrane receptor protein
MYKRFMKNVSLIALACAATSGGATVVTAQDADADANAEEEELFLFEEIVVTGTKMGAARLMDVPQAIQSFSAESLAVKRVYELQDLMTAIPGASQQAQVSASNRTYSLRGSGGGGGVGDSLVGYYIDDVPFGIPNYQGAPAIHFFDLDRVEVLRGPQGTLYGQGSMGGTIIFRTKDPDLSNVVIRGGSSFSTTEDAGGLNYSVSGAVSVPVVEDKFAIAVSGGYDFQNGYADVYSGAPEGSPLLEDGNDITAKDYRVVALWEPNDQLRVRAQYWRFESSQDYIQGLTSLEPPQLNFQGSIPGLDRSATDFATLTIEYDFGGVKLSNSAGYQDLDPFEFVAGFDLDFFGGAGTLTLGQPAKSFVNELRLNSDSDGPLKWMLGGFYQDAESTFSSILDFPSFYLETVNRTETKNYSVFGEVSHELFDGKLVPLFGLRYYSDKRKGTDGGTGAVTEGSPEVVNWRVNLAYHPSDNWTVFYNMSTGFRSGIIQSEVQASTASTAVGFNVNQALDPDKLTNYEFGLKTTLLDGTLQLQSSVYHIKYTDFQGQLTPGGLTVFANFGNAETTGWDVEFDWITPIDGLTLAFSGNVNGSKYHDVPDGFAISAPGIADGGRLINTPKFNWRVDVAYATPIGDTDWEFVARASASQNDGLVLEDARQFDTWEAYSATLGVQKENLEITLFGDNLSDYRGPVTSNAPTLLSGPYPRTIGLRLRLKELSW